MSKRSDYYVENEPIKAQLNDIGSSIGKRLPPGWGFTLFLFAYGEDNGDPRRGLFYISSAQRKDMIETVKEWLLKQGESSLL